MVPTFSLASWLRTRLSLHRLLALSLLSLCAPGAWSATAVHAGEPSIELDGQWSFEADEAIAPAPTVTDDIVLVPSLDGTVYALDADNGDEEWDAPHYPNDGVVAGEDIVFTVEFDDESGEGRLVARTLDDGDEEWSLETEDGFHAGMPIVTDEGVVLVGLSRREVPSGGDPFVMVVALDLDDGSELWTMEDAALNAAADGIAVVLFAGQRLGLDVMTGDERWDTDEVVSSIHEGVVYGVWQDELVAVELESGNELWTIDVEEFGSDLYLYAADDETLYLGENRDDGFFLMAFDAKDQQAIWTVEDLPGPRGDVAVDDDLLILGLERDSSDLPGGVVILDASTGEIVSEPGVPEDGADGLAIGDGALYVVTWKTLYRYDY